MRQNLWKGERVNQNFETLGRPGSVVFAKELDSTAIEIALALRLATATTATPQMADPRFGRVPDLPPSLAQAEAQIHFFGIHKKFFVQATHNSIGLNAH
jgi:hypothetical protein